MANPRPREHRDSIDWRISPLVLSSRDFERFIEIINDSSPPTPELAQAVRDYEALREAYPDRGL